MGVAFIIIFTPLGMVVASFLNICCDRLSTGESLVYPPSHCAACQRCPRAKDLIPVATCGREVAATAARHLSSGAYCR